MEGVPDIRDADLTPYFSRSTSSTALVWRLDLELNIPNELAAVIVGNSGYAASCFTIPCVSMAWVNLRHDISPAKTSALAIHRHQV